ncbi:MAG: GH25 family lysozyme [Bacteroidota bacterium]
MTISKNSSHSLIKSWQTFLYDQGFTEVGTPDGYWGAHTEAASKAFQQANGLTADGIVGSGTIATAEKKGFTLPEAKPFAPAGTLNAIFDISHSNPSADFVKAKAAGMLAVFHKATQSAGRTAFRDKTYASRKKEAAAAGLLWGAYHFGSGDEDGATQADFFLTVAQPDGNTLLVLDFETNTTGSETTMSLEQAKAFISRIYEQTGKYPGIYGGSWLKEQVRSGADTVLSKCWLWIAEYELQPILPNGWDKYTFWQYTDGTHGPGALPVDGIGHCDRDLFNGTAEELAAFWKSNSV